MQIRLRNLKRNYASLHAVDDVSLDIPSNTVYGIIGRSGAGKSTLMRIIGGAIAPDKGTVERTSRISWPIGFSGGFHGSLTGRENLRFVCRIYKADIREVTAFVEEFSELEDYLDMPIKTYSSGMAAKLAFGLSMAIGFDFYLVDTAGIRKKGKVTEDIEYYSVIRSIRAIESSDVCILMIDATRGIESQDLNIFSLIQKNKKGLVVCVNKWDLVEDKSNKAIKTFESAIRERFAPFVDFPIVYASALTKQRIYKVLESAVEVYKNRTTRIPTAKLNEEMLTVIENYPPPAHKGKYVKIKYVTQLKETVVPTFVFFCNLPQWVKDPYKRFLENKIRSKWNFSGTPINIFMREK